MPTKNIVWVKIPINWVSDNPGNKFNQLDPDEKWIKIGMILLYPECDNAIPYDKQWIKNRLVGIYMTIKTFGQKLDRVIQMSGWRIKDNKVYITDFKDYKHYKSVYTNPIPKEKMDAVIQHFKITHCDVDPDDKEWDESCCPKFVRATREYLIYFKLDVEKVNDFIDQIIEECKKEGLSWSFSTGLNHMAKHRRD